MDIEECARMPTRQCVGMCDVTGYCFRFETSPGELYAVPVGEYPQPDPR